MIEYDRKYDWGFVTIITVIIIIVIIIIVSMIPERTFRDYRSRLPMRSTSSSGTGVHVTSIMIAFASGQEKGASVTVVRLASGLIN